MPIGSETFVRRRPMPHIEKRSADYFVTFSTLGRAVLEIDERDIVYATCLYEHRRSSFLHCFTVMPDHVHIVLMPLETFRLPTVLQRIKSVSSHRMKGQARAPVLHSLS